MHCQGDGQRIKASPSLFEKYHKFQEECKYIEDSTYSRSIGNHDCMTWSEFYYSSQVSCGWIFVVTGIKNLFGTVNIKLIHLSSIRKKKTSVLIKNLFTNIKPHDKL